MPMKSPALVVGAINQIALDEVEIPSPEAGEVLVRAELTTISPGTELRCMAGKQEGAVGFPYVPGYAMIGRVEERGTGVETPVGARVFCTGTIRVGAGMGRTWGGHTAWAVTTEARLIPVPEGVSLANAAMVRLAGISFHGYKMVGADPDEPVVVLGLGPIGMLSALIHQAGGARVLVVDPIAERRALAEQLGLAAFAPDDADGRSYFPGGAGVVVDSTGVPAVLESALGWLREPAWNAVANPRGVLVVQGSYGAQPIAVPYQEAFRRETTLMVPRDALVSDFCEVMAWCAEGRLNLEPVLSGIFSPEEAPSVYGRLMAKDAGLVTAAFRWSDLQSGADG